MLINTLPKNTTTVQFIFAGVTGINAGKNIHTMVNNE
jgi:hypothetical protein